MTENLRSVEHGERFLLLLDALNDCTKARRQKEMILDLANQSLSKLTCRVESRKLVGKLLLRRGRLAECQRFLLDPELINSPDQTYSDNIRNLFEFGLTHGCRLSDLSRYLRTLEETNCPEYRLLLYRGQLAEARGLSRDALKTFTAGLKNNPFDESLIEAKLRVEKSLNLKAQSQSTQRRLELMQAAHRKLEIADRLIHDEGNVSRALVMLKECISDGNSSFSDRISCANHFMELGQHALAQKALAGLDAIDSKDLRLLAALRRFESRPERVESICDFIVKQQGCNYRNGQFAHIARDNVRAYCRIGKLDKASQLARRLRFALRGDDLQALRQSYQAVARELTKRKQYSKAREFLAFASRLCDDTQLLRQRADLERTAGNPAEAGRLLRQASSSDEKWMAIFDARDKK